MCDLKISPELMPCLVTHVETSGPSVVVWAQRDIQSVMTFENKLDHNFKHLYDKYFAINRDNIAFVPQIGKYYIYCDKSKMNFYRVLVKSSDPEVTAADHSLVMFIDFGYDELVTNHRLIVYEDLFVDCKPLAERFLLDGIRAPEDTANVWDLLRVNECLKPFLQTLLWFATYGHQLGPTNAKVAKVFDSNGIEILVETLRQHYFSDTNNGSTPDLIAIDFETTATPLPPLIGSQPLVEIGSEPSIDSRLESALNLNDDFKTSTLSLISDVSYRTFVTKDATIEETIDLPLNTEHLLTAQELDINPDYEVKSDSLVTEDKPLSNTTDSTCDDQLDAKVDDNCHDLETKNITSEDMCVENFDDNSIISHKTATKSVSFDTSLDDNVVNDSQDINQNTYNEVKDLDINTDDVLANEFDQQMATQLDRLFVDKLYSLSECKREMKIKISSAESSSSIYCQLMDTSEELDSLVTDMTDYYGNMRGLEVTDEELKEAVVTNGLLAVYNSLESQWMRGRVCGQPNDSQLKVSYIDFGGVATVDADTCCRLIDCYERSIPLAIHCRPINGNITYYLLKRLESREEVIDVVFGRVLDNSVIEVLLSADCFK